MAETFAGSGTELGTATQTLYRPTEQLSESHQEGQERSDSCQTNLGSTQEESRWTRRCGSKTAEQEDSNTTDLEAEALVQQVQQVFQACVKAAAKEEPMEVSDAEEAPAVPSKRPRSMEPFGGSAPGPPS